jgi:hypothetical protein
MASALEIGAEGWTGDIGFNQARTATDTSLPGEYFFWGWSLSASQAITDNVSFKADVGSDPLLRNVAHAIFTYQENFLSVGIGPFFGFFNDPSTVLKSGISTSIRLEAPSIAFVSFRSDSSISGELLLVGDYLQTRNEIALGFYVPNAICTLSLATREFEQKQSEDTVIDKLTEYAFSTDIYQKNVPYRVVLTFSYQELSRSFVDAVVISMLDSFVVGAEIDVTLSKTVTLRTGFDTVIYSFGVGNLAASDPYFLFHATAGVRITVPS